MMQKNVLEALLLYFGAIDEAKAILLIEALDSACAYTNNAATFVGAFARTNSVWTLLFTVFVPFCALLASHSGLKRGCRNVSVRNFAGRHRVADVEQVLGLRLTLCVQVQNELDRVAGCEILDLHVMKEDITVALLGDLWAGDE